jgi:hypothetical protein
MRLKMVGTFDQPALACWAFSVARLPAAKAAHSITAAINQTRRD